MMMHHKLFIGIAVINNSDVRIGENNKAYYKITHKKCT